MEITQGDLHRLADAMIELASAIKGSNSDKPLSVQQASDRLNLPPRTVYDLCATGKLQHQRHGKRRGTIRILPKAIENYLRKAS